VRLTVVGCAGSYPNAMSPASCYVIEHDGQRIVLDMGNGSLGALHSVFDPLAPDSIQAVLLSHCHIDHCADLASLFVARHHYGPRDLPRLVVYGPSDTKERLASIYGMRDPSLIDESFDLRVHQPTAEVGAFTITTAPAAHPVEAYSIRATAGGHSITYSGDTGPTSTLVELSHGTDIALFEASFVGHDNPPDLHMSGADAGRVAASANVGSLLLTHLVARNDEVQVLDEARAVFAGPIAVARPALSLTV